MTKIVYFETLATGDVFWDYYPDGDKFVKITDKEAIGLISHGVYKLLDFSRCDVEVEYKE